MAKINADARNAQRRRAGRARKKLGGLPRRLFVKKEKVPRTLQGDED